jgi:hypothetical protein
MPGQRVYEPEYVEDKLLELRNAERELAFLRYFYDAAGEAFGPADLDVYASIRDDYEGEIPEGYGEDE